MCRDRGETAAAHGGHDGALRLDALPRLGIVRRRDEVLVVRPHLESERALPRLGEHRLRLEAVADLVAEPEPVEPARCEHDRVEPALPALAQTGVDVAAQRLDREHRIERQ